MTAQDDEREKEQIKIFNLEEFSEHNRGREYFPDAKLKIDNKFYTIELKTKPKFQFSKGKKKNYRSVSTARGFGPGKVKEWSEKVDLFLFSEHDNGVFEKHYLLTFEMLKPELKRKVLDPYYKGRKSYYGVDKFNSVILPLLENNIPKDEILKFKHTFENGAKLNDPKISWTFIENNGILVKNRKDIVDFIIKYKINSRK